MTRFRRALLAISGFALLGLAISAVTQKSAMGVSNPTQSVNVTNPSLNVNASQTGTWNVGISGTPSVNVGTPTVTLGTGSTVGINGAVQVGNPATSPVLVRDLDSPARNPFQVELCSGGNCPVIPPNYFSVPVGQEFVVEYVSGKCDGPVGKISLSFDNAAGSQLGTAWLNDLAITDTTGVRFGQVVRIYADQRTQIVLGTYFFGGPGQGNEGCDVTLSGYLITL